MRNELIERVADFLNAFKADPFSTGADKAERLLEIVAAYDTDDRIKEQPVPREPTQAMLMAGRKQTFADMTGEHCGPSAENTWKAMYDAALKGDA